MSASAENPRLLEIAEAIADGTPIDWAEECEKTGAVHADLVEELRALQIMARFGSETPSEWGSFVIKGEIGRGAFGTVYQARNRELDIDVALKVIRPANPDAAFDAQRALSEARLLARINHPNVVRVFDAERIENEVGVWMELVQGSTLQDLVQRQGRFSASEASIIAIDLCHALTAVHAAETLHGDIKAHNVMRARGGRTVLMDFGTGKDLSVPVEPSSSDFAGTPMYLAPEVFSGAMRSRASDIYSLGVLLYYLVTGAYPVEGDTRSEITNKHRAHTRPRPLREVRPDLPERFVQAVERALAEQPADRYQSAGQFEAALLQAGAVSRVRILAGLAAVALIGVGGAAAMMLGLLPRSGEVSSAAAATAPSYSINAGLYRSGEADGTEVRLGADDRLARGDRVSLQLQASIPAYVYIVDEDERGKSFLLFPLPGQGTTNPLPAHVRHRLPGVVDGQDMAWQVTTAGQREHFLLFVSPTPSPEFERMFERLPPPTVNGPSLSAQLSPQDLDVLRGVGGLAPSPKPAAGAQVDLQLRNVPEFSTPLSLATETAHGVWVRRLSVANPAD